MGALERSVLLGSDLLEENLALARAGDYPEDVRARMRWERRDLAADGPPPGRWRLILCRNVAIYLSPAGAPAACTRRWCPRSATRGVLLLGPQRAADRPGRARPAAGGPARVRAGRMRRRLTARTLAVSALIVAVVAVVLGGLAIAIDRQHKAGERARHSQAVIAAANLTAQRVLGVQTLIRGFLIRGNPDLARRLPRRRAPRCRPRRSSCSCWSSPIRASAGSPSGSAATRWPTSTTTRTR